MAILPDRILFDGAQSSAVERPEIFSYLNYRQFLDDFVLYLRAMKLYSARKFALVVGFKSPSYLKMIIDGHRNIGTEVVARLAGALNLKKDEVAFFEKLVLFNQTENMDLKDRAYEDLLTFRKFRSVHAIEAAQYEFYSRWYLPIVFEAAGYLDWTSQKAEFAQRLQISIPEVDRSLEILEKLGLVERRQKTILKKDISLETDPEASHLYIRNFHREMMTQALKKVDTIPQDQRDLQGLTIALSEEEAKEFKKMMYNFIAKMNKKFSGSVRPKKIYQLSTQFFPILDLPTSGDGKN